MVVNSGWQGQIARAEERFRKYQKTWDLNRGKIQGGARLQADTPERIKRRILRLTAREPSRGAEAVTAGLQHDPGVLERVLGKNDLISVNFLEIGLHRARSVGRVVIRDSAGRLEGFGTGFLVSPQLLMTNNHVLESAGGVGASIVEFNFQLGPDGRERQSIAFALNAQRFFRTDRDLDYTLIAVEPRSTTGDQLSSFGFIRLIEEEGKATIGECLNIVQHPNGETKQLAFRENALITILDPEPFLHYRTDTAPGSSGSPVFSDTWELVALHHSGVPKRDAQGRFLSVDGKVWTPEMGEQKIDWIANEGARVSRIVKHVKNLNLPDAERALVKEMFDAEPPELSATPERGITPGSGSLRAPVMHRDRTITWTIPIEVSIRIGDIPPNVVASAPQPAAMQPPLPRPPDRPAEPVSPPPELDAAIRDLREAAEKPYYDEQKDEQERSAYYRFDPATLEPVQFYNTLADLLKQTHRTKLSYKPAVMLYPWVDLQPPRNGDFKLRSIYSAQEFEPEEIIREDFRIDRERAQFRETLLRESVLTAEQIEQQLDLLEATMPYNCEHVVPQSWFNKKNPMRGDLHHLFTCEKNCNSFRGNTPYFDFADFEGGIPTGCGKRERDRFEPNAGKGAVARATLYFLLRYPGQALRAEQTFDAGRIPALLQWHRDDPPGLWERHRNMAIFQKQGNRNPLIDSPEWAAQIDFAQGLSRPFDPTEAFDDIG
jgi:endonuclease I/V8-like Glu-specific endopeptidase